VAQLYLPVVRVVGGYYWGEDDRQHHKYNEDPREQRNWIV